MTLKREPEALLVVQNEITALEERLKKLKEAVIDYDNADTLLYRMRTNDTVRSLAGEIRESHLLGDRGAYHVCNISPRRCSVIRRSCLVGKRYCEFDVIKTGLTPQEADDLASQLNKEMRQHETA